MSLNPLGGNVGIGTTSPSYLLTAYAASLSQFALSNATRNFILSNNAGDGLLSFSYASVNRLQFDTTNQWFNTGKVGIGTTAPVAKLHIGSDLESNMSNQTLFVQGSKTGYAGFAGLPMGGLMIYDDTASTAGAGGAIGFGANTGSSQRTWIAAIESRRDSATNDASNYAGSLVFYTRPAQATPEERMRIKSDGNVGIGRTSPQQKLHIAGTNARLAISNDSDNNWAEIGNDGSSGQNTLEFFTGSSVTSAMSITNANNVGIGTTSPTLSSGKGLHINSDSGHANLKLQSSGRTWELLSTTGAYFSIFDTTGGSDRLSISSAGNVGVGTTSPADKLEVNGTTRTKKLRSNGIYYVGITGAKTSNASAFDMFDISNTNGNQTIEIVLSHHHSGGGQHGSFRRVILALNSYVAVIVLEDTSTNFGGGLGFTITRTSTSTIRIGWAGATAFATSYSFIGWIKGNGDYSVTNVGMDSLDAA
jgi:hypothetical protein